MHNNRRLNILLGLAVLAILLQGYALWRPEANTLLGRGTPTPTVSLVPLVTVHSATAAMPTVTPVTLSESCPAGQKDYEKQLFGDEAAPLGAYVTLTQFSRSGACWLEVRHYTAGKSSIWYHAAAIPDKHRTSYPLRLLDGTGELFLVVHITSDYKLHYTVESVR